MKNLFAFVILITAPLVGQHQLPFASTNNTIELSVANTSTVATSNVVVAATSAPQWLQIVNSKFQITTLKSNETSTARFAFSVDKSAPVNKSEQVTFTITNSNGERWTKTLSLQVSPPEKFELFQNYPNPFNPSTIISYQLPVNSELSLKVYDLLGREVTTLEEGMKEAGYHQKEWNALGVASGVYIYQLTTSSEQGKKEYFRKKMIVVK